MASKHNPRFKINRFATSPCCLPLRHCASRLLFGYVG